VGTVRDVGGGGEHWGNWRILMRKTHLLHAELSLEEWRQILSRFVTGLVPYAVATALAFASQYATLAICAAIAVFYALPVASGVRGLGTSPKKIAPGACAPGPARTGACQRGLRIRGPVG
jgi:hypothetical protein